MLDMALENFDETLTGLKRIGHLQRIDFLRWRDPGAWNRPYPSLIWGTLAMEKLAIRQV